MGGPLPSVDGRAAPTAASTLGTSPLCPPRTGSWSGQGLTTLPVQEFMLLKETLKSKGLWG